jgi:hypothetical protein
MTVAGAFNGKGVASPFCNPFDCRIRFMDDVLLEHGPRVIGMPDIIVAAHSMGTLRESFEHRNTITRKLYLPFPSDAI